MKQLLKEELILSIIVLIMAGVGPNIFPAAMAGYSSLSVLAPWTLLPSFIVLLLCVSVAVARGHEQLVNRVTAGAAAGFLATIGLEVVRMTSFQLGGMPGDLPRLMGVLLTDRFMLGPSIVSDILGWTYHFWNGAAFGIIFTIFLGRRPVSWTILYGLLIGAGFLFSPVVDSFGIGFAGLDMPTMPMTVILAHMAYGWLLGIFNRRWTSGDTSVMGSLLFFIRRSCKSSPGVISVRS